ncbi:MAG: DNA double-strand break repair nuclease NurA [Desulfurobacteriaceae bacterium]
MGIKRFLIETALKKRETLNLKSSEVKRFQELAEQIWIPFDPEPNVVPVVYAVDGSMNKKEFAGQLVYAIGAGSVLFENGKEANKEGYEVDIDILKPEEYSDARLRMLMGILEVKEALKVVDKSSIIFIDGSIVGSVIRPTVFSYEINEEIEKRVEDLFNELIEDFSLGEITSKKFYKRIEEFAKGKEFPVAAGYLEYLEYLYSLYLLLEKGSEKIVAISKRSDSRNYQLDSILPDITVLNYADLPVGYSEPKEIKIHKEKKFKFPIEFEEKLRKYSFNSFFVRLPKGNGVYKVETMISVNVLFPILKYFAIRGYPYPLKVVHHRVKITKKDMDDIIYTLKVRGITGREALGE